METGTLTILLALVGVGAAVIGVILRLDRLSSRRIDRLEQGLAELRSGQAGLRERMTKLETDLRERMAKLEGLLEGLRETVAGRRAA